ncbi:50S ribosomal protein L3 N(5)-glutamine methyltransferase [bacterium]|nr:50S ribosomal protein L3 N(5)-glutamine methyltransferase [bacterium]
MAVPVLDAKETYTIEAAIRAAAHRFEKRGLCYGHGTDSAIDEASWLILSAMGLSPANAPDYQLQLNAEQVDACNTLLSRRMDERIPAAYLTAQAWFAGHRFICDRRALVPRSPLAELINSDYFGLLDAVESPLILDLCTGGGCIAIACAHASPDAVIHASDVSSEALALAQENIDLHDVHDRVALLTGSLFEPVTARYDLIISNPPYVDAQDIAAMPEEFAHEPMLGLAAGSDGLDLVRLMLRDASGFLNPDGLLIVEVGNSWQALETAYPGLDFAWLEFAHGGHGVFMLTRDQLMEQFTG